VNTVAEGQLIIALSSAVELDQWFQTISCVAAGQAKIIEWAELLKLPPYPIISFKFDASELNECLTLSGYKQEQFEETFFTEYISQLHGSFISFIAQDSPDEFANAFNAQFAAKTIVLKPWAGEGADKPYNQASLSSEGELVINFRRKDVRTNLSEMTEKLLDSITIDHVPYVAVRSVRRWIGERDKALNEINDVLGITGTAFVDNIPESLVGMKDKGYTPDRYGEIFYITHLNVILTQLKRWKETNPDFKAAFSSRFSGKKIRILQASAATKSTMQGYYRSEFTTTGDLLIEYKELNTNIHELGSDFNDVTSR